MRNSLLLDFRDINYSLAVLVAELITLLKAPLIINNQLSLHPLPLQSLANRITGHNREDKSGNTMMASLTPFVE